MKTKTDGPNTKLAYRTLDYVQAHPEQHDQYSWGVKTYCGTVGCFAYWTVKLDNPKVKIYDGMVMPRFVTVGVAARRLLRLTPEQAENLFYCSNSELEEIVHYIFGARPKEER